MLEVGFVEPYVQAIGREQDMTSTASTLVMCALLGAAGPLAAQSAHQQQADAQPRIVNVPGQGYVYMMPVPADDTRSVEHVVNVPGYGDVRVVPVRPKDTRSARQRCVDEEIAREGGSPSELATRAIDLKCSQR
jgi:hypothetical protein